VALRADQRAASFADTDNDGKPDLFVTYGAAWQHLFHNLGGGKFEASREQSGLCYPGTPPERCFFDYNRDGLVDCFFSNGAVIPSE